MSEPQLTATNQQEPGPRAGNRFAAMLARPGWLCLLLAAVTFAVFWPVKNCGYVNYDDPQYVTSNHQVRQGLTLKGVAWAFTTGQTANWHPLTWLSHMLDVQLFGLNPAGPHLVNVALHAVNAVLLLVVLRQLTGALWRCAFVAALFALHPLHVESVAWISERKDVLSTLFWLLTLWAYAHYARGRTGRNADGSAEPGRNALPRVQADLQVGPPRGQHAQQVVPATTNLKCPGARWYMLALLFFALGLMAKPMLVTLPFVLLLLDYWPLGRFQSFRVSEFQSFGVQSSEPEAEVPKPSTFNLQPSTFPRLSAEKIPFFILSGVFCFVTFAAQRNSGAVLTLANIPMGMRIENVFVSYARYLGKLIWPFGLALPYPYPTEWPMALVIFSAGFTMVLCVAAWFLGRRWPFVRTGWFWFFGTLIPVIGLVQVGAQSLADRYTYVPSIGIFILLAWGACAAFERWHFPIWTAAAAAILVLGACAARTIDQLGCWRNSETLFRHAIASTRNNGLACDNLGVDLFAHGRLDDAIQAYETALKINPKDPIALDGMGCCFFNKDQMAEATKWLQRSLQVNTNQSNSLFNMGSVLAQQQRYPEAIKYYKDALKIDPENPDIYDSLGNVFLRQKRYVEAIRCYEDASRLAPESPSPHNCLGAIQYELGKVDEAIHHYQESVWLAPGEPQTHIILGNLLARQGRLQEAANHYAKALQINPNSIEALNNLGWLLAGTGQYDKALECYTRAVRLAPEQESLHRSLAQVLSAENRNDEALREYGEALRLAPNDAQSHLGLAGVLASVGRKNEAIAHAKEALRLQPDYDAAKQELQSLQAPAPK